MFSQGQQSYLRSTSTHPHVHARTFTASYLLLFLAWNTVVACCIGPCMGMRCRMWWWLHQDVSESKLAHICIAEVPLLFPPHLVYLGPTTEHHYRETRKRITANFSSWALPLLDLAEESTNMSTSLVLVIVVPVPCFKWKVRRTRISVAYNRISQELLIIIGKWHLCWRSWPFSIALTKVTKRNYSLPF